MPPNSDFVKESVCPVEEDDTFGWIHVLLRRRRSLSSQPEYREVRVFFSLFTITCAFLFGDNVLLSSFL